jgi:hypothetical protein
MAQRKSLCNENIESKLNCDIDSDNYVEDTESDEDEDYYDEEEQPSPPVQ